MGGYSRPSLFKGVELNAWGKETGCDAFIALSASLVVQWYPRIASGFYLKGGAGLAVGGPPLLIGLSPNLGLGYDWRLTRNFSLGPQVNYVRILAPSERDWDAVQLGVGFTWH